MFGSGLMSWLRPSEAVPESKWDPETLTMEQPASPSGPSMEHVVTEQPRTGESMQLQIRGGAVLVSAALNAASAAAIVAATTGRMVLPLLPAHPDLHE
ncbi:uncharacterized protein BO88DRAFT_488388 [Aspergillus vadensis CBS 113365]|uniref:Uncharacterized protein n=1 Tax=Aspergillus vadensis (strain CBS 113365 / IMI 142717 / IBT 24658) TaxID=1448311 RepID=A0A319B6J8_ASPVC|nr:hypothetical protein BO88DRAFT_488388 [Aspergillus vadensis CBS 113365]PYH68427.1 hypothetical protein BO88DRAFT_488388 [Aspergillus vadensis CBS 113365]